MRSMYLSQKKSTSPPSFWVSRIQRRSARALVNVGSMPIQAFSQLNVSGRR